MKVSREKVAENHEAILEAAGLLFREKGFDSVGVAEVMNAAGLTHGGFYGHFKSKDDLIAQTMTYLLEQASSDVDFDVLVDRYLSPAHRDNPATGCPTAALAAATRRQSKSAREAMTTGQRGFIEALSKKADGNSAAARRRTAIATWSAMVGAITLARAVEDRKLAAEILRETRAWIAAK